MNIKNYDNISLYVGLIIGSMTTIIVISFFIVVDLKSIEYHIKLLSYPFIAGSAVIALFQFKQNTIKHKKDESWNKKHLAFEKISSYIKELEELRLEIDKILVKSQVIKNDNGNIISFTDRRRTQEPLTHEEVHSWVCKNYKVSTTTDMCSMTEEGVIIVRNMLSIINIYELIAIGIKNDILDRELVKEALEHVIVKNYEFFSLYIKHRRDNHSDETLATEWELLHKDFTNI